jgi:hypothetical protein
MAIPITCRPFRPTDMPAVSRLWAEEAGWGELTAEKWTEWFERTPYGPCLVLVAEAASELVGQIVFTPTMVQADDLTVPAMRISAPIVRRAFREGSIRSLSLLHPAIKLWWDGLVTAAATGTQLVYTLPDASWKPILSLSGRFRIAEFECWEAAGPVAAGPGRWRTIGCNGFGAEHEQLWEDARARFGFGCGVRRTSAWLSYRLAGCLTRNIFDPDGRLAGWLSIHATSGLIQDVVARDQEALVQVLWAGSAMAGEGAASPSVVKLMVTPTLRAAAAAAGFTPANYPMPFAVDVLDPRLDPAQFTPDRWHSVPSD